MAQTAEQIVQTYLSRLVEIRSTGGATGETSYYAALETLLNEVGGLLDPNVICNGQLRNQGAGHPDFGLYSKKQCQKGEPKPGQGEIPERGVVEVKPLSDDTWQTSKGKQATKYFDRYGLVLVTNYRDFRLIGADSAGKPTQREFFSLAPDEPAFWVAAAHSTKTAKERAVHFIEFLQRILMNAAPLTKAEDVAWFLASYARDALATLEVQDATALAPLRQALETALGIKFEGDKGEHFFRSTLIQTLFYGVFSAWVVWARNGAAGKYDWRHAGFILTVPMIRTLFEEIAKPSRLKPLGLMDVLDRTGEALNRVDRAAFFANFETGHPVQLFYEPFLEAFDPQLRKDLGVWYTPPEIVRYMVARVDSVLRSELGVADGLADKKVYVLDPCCGTGAYLVEVLRKIEETLRSKGNDALIGDDVKDAARDRVFGFEILSAPFVIAHWQIGDLLARLNAPLDASKGERPSIYLTNSLTGWETAIGPKATLPLFPELEQERDQAEHVKRDVPILVVLGNPPYNAFAGTSPEEEHGLVDPYKDGLIKAWGIKKFNLDDLYVRFFRIAERRITETGRGIFSYISNYSYLSDPSFVVARERLLKEFDAIWVDCMNGDSRATGKLTPEGLPDPSVFSTSYNREGIRVGTAVGLFVRRAVRDKAPTVRFRNFWGAMKRDDLVKSLNTKNFEDQYEISNPTPFNKFSFRSVAVSQAYQNWPSLKVLGAKHFNGPVERRGMALISIEQAPLASRMEAYFDITKADEDIAKLYPALMMTGNRIVGPAARKKLLKESKYDQTKIVPYPFKPFDIRHCYLDNIRPLFSEPSPDLLAHRSPENWFLVSRDTADKTPEGPPFFGSHLVCDYDFISGHARHFPILVLAGGGKGSEKQHTLAFAEKRKWYANLSGQARDYLTKLAYQNPDENISTAELIWLHVLAVGFSPLYLGDNAEGIRSDWPRVPLPSTTNALDQSAALGRQLLALLDAESNVPGITSGDIGECYKVLGSISATDLKINSGWGHADKNGRIFPGKGKIVVREWSEAERAALEAAFLGAKLSRSRGFELLGRPIDVFLNDATYWHAVPEQVWEFYIGGYQVIKKWLSYREEPLLHRALTKDEAREVTSTIRRLTAIVLMTDELDANYTAVRDHAYPWENTGLI
jgi:Type ISP C-terminal specificity domain/N-6 DNA Methylase